MMESYWKSSVVCSEIERKFDIDDIIIASGIERIAEVRQKLDVCIY